MSDFTATFLARSGLDFVEHEAVRAKAQISSKTAFGGIKPRQQITFQQFGKKALCEVLSVLRRLRIFQPEIFIDRLPIGHKKQIERARALHAIRTSRGGNN